MHREALLTVSQVSKRFDLYEKPAHRLWDVLLPKRFAKSNEYWALRDITFSVGKGETVAIVGRNGCGKSTLLQLVCSILNPTQGSIQVFGRIAALLELGSGFNSQFTGRENIFLYASILGLSHAETESIYQDILRFADIGHFIDYPLSTYSSGMIVRLAFATAIHVSPDLLVIDEALAVGDTAFQQKCLMQIRKMQKMGISILLVTHSSNAVIEYCDRAIYLRRGELVTDGSTRDVVKKYSQDLVDDEKSEIAFQSQLNPIEFTQDIASCSTKIHGESDLQIRSVSLLNAEQIEQSAFLFSDQITVVVHIEARTSIDNPCAGIQLSSVDGIALWSCTTQSIDSSFPALKPGNNTISWKINANFAGNRYILSVGIGEILNGEYKRHDRLDYAAHFDVMPESKSGSGWLAPKPQFSPLVQVVN